MTTFDYFDSGFNDAPCFGRALCISLLSQHQPELIWDIDGTLWINGHHWVRTFSPQLEEVAPEPIVMGWWDDSTFLPVPEPSAFGLVALGLVLLARWRRA